VLLGSGAGCIEFGTGESKTADDVIETKQDVVRNPAADRATVSLDGTVLTVRGKAACDLVEMATVEQTTTREREFRDEDELPVALVEAFSLVPIGAGIALLADAPAVYDDDPNQRLYNATGQDSVIAAGAVLLAVGVAMNVWPTVELIRWATPETDSSTSERPGQVLQRNVPCTAELSRGGSAVSLRWPAGTLNVGTTDTDGKLVVDLKQVLSISHFQSGTPPVSMNVFLNEQLVGNVGVTAVGLALLEERRAQDDFAWRTAEPAACSEQPTEGTCAGVRRYLGSFPQGRHAGEANALVARIGQPAGGGTLVVVERPEDAVAARAIAVAQAAAQKLMSESRAKRDEAARLAREKFEADTQKAVERFDAEEQKAAEASEKKIQREGRELCLRTCRTECAADRTCRTRCEEACP
jgi:hypothetical protein